MKDSKVRIELNSSGIREILKSEMMMSALEAEAEKMGEIDSTYVGINRCNVRIKENGNVNRREN